MKNINLFKNKCLYFFYPQKLSFYFIIFILLSLFLFKSSEIMAQKKQRIISLKPNITAILYDLGVGDQLVGVTQYCQVKNQNIKKVGDYVQIDVEAIVSQKPDLVITSSENSQQKQILALQGMGVKVLIVEFHNLDEMFQSLVKIGKDVGKETEALQLQQKMEQDFNKIKEENLRAWSATPKRFAIVVQRQPLVVAGGTAFLSTIFERVGLKNTFSKNEIRYPVYDPEVLAYEPIDYLFELQHNKASTNQFLNHSVIALPIEEFLAHPSLTVSLSRLFHELRVKKTMK